MKNTSSALPITQMLMQFLPMQDAISNDAKQKILKIGLVMQIDKRLMQIRRRLDYNIINGGAYPMSRIFISIFSI